MNTTNALYIIALIMGLQFIYTIVSSLVAMTYLKRIFERKHSNNDVEQDMELFDEGYIKGLLDFLNKKLEYLIEFYSNTSQLETSIHCELGRINDLDKVKQMGKFFLQSPNAEHMREIVVFSERSDIFKNEN